MPIHGRQRFAKHFSRNQLTAEYWQDGLILLRKRYYDDENKTPGKIQKQTLKDEKLHQMEISGAEAVVQSLIEEGFTLTYEEIVEMVSPF